MLEQKAVILCFMFNLPRYFRQSCHISYFFPHWKLQGAIGRDIIIGQNNTTLNIEQHLVLNIKSDTLIFQNKSTSNVEQWTLNIDSAIKVR